MQNPSPEFIIGPAQSTDLEAIDRIEREAFNTPWSRDLLRGAVVNGKYRARALRSPEGHLIGFYIAHVMGRQSNLDNLAVDAWARGRGYGSHLIKDWIQQARLDGGEMLTLQVNTANKGAQRLYERFRFQTAKLLVSYYPNGDDAYQMVLNLKPSPDREGREGILRRGRNRGNLSLVT
ncbi:MAG: GNAT family N-acetyltransferase [SAR324 cluster bacterium]|nr:GNAT family N-acetyltransferase [SAR324 cluster bacterium]